MQCGNKCSKYFTEQASKYSAGPALYSLLCPALTVLIPRIALTLRTPLTALTALTALTVPAVPAVPTVSTVLTLPTVPNVLNVLMVEGFTGQHSPLPNALFGVGCHCWGMANVRTIGGIQETVAWELKLSVGQG